MPGWRWLCRRRTPPGDGCNLAGQSVKLNAAFGQAFEGAEQGEATRASDDSCELNIEL
jgi:hypothetical protein